MSSAVGFNINLPAFVGKQFTGDVNGKAVVFPVGAAVDWRKFGWREDRVEAMGRSRFLVNKDVPAPRFARPKQAQDTKAKKRTKTKGKLTTMELTAEEVEAVLAMRAR